RAAVARAPAHGALPGLGGGRRHRRYPFRGHDDVHAAVVEQIAYAQAACTAEDAPLDAHAHGEHAAPAAFGIVEPAEVVHVQVDRRDPVADGELPPDVEPHRIDRADVATAKPDGHRGGDSLELDRARGE